MPYENIQRTSEPPETTQEQSACVVRPRMVAKRGSIELAERIRDDTLERREARHVEDTGGREACRVAERRGN